MIVFRLSKSKFAQDFSGKGAEKSGGRWNSKGTALIYTSASRALCTTEIAVHTPLGNLPFDYKLISIEIPDKINILKIDTPALPVNWKTLPHSYSTREIGDKFVSDGIFAVLQVPSAVVQDEFNFLINPAHADFQNIHILAIEPFDFDERLFIK